MSRTDCTCTVSNVPKTRDPSAIGQQSSLVTDLAQIHRLTLCIITVASSSEDGPGTIRNFEKLFPLFWKKRQENTGLLPGTKITMSIKPHLREIQGEKKWSDARGVFLEVARREGNTKSVRKAIVRSSAWNPSRGGKKKTARDESSSIEHFWRVLPYRGLINRCHYRAWIHFARPDLFAKMTRNRWRRPIDTTRRGTGRQRDSRNGGTIRREKIRSTIDR